jgi:lysophospholipase L1-like esterase
MLDVNARGVSVAVLSLAMAACSAEAGHESDPGPEPAPAPANGSANESASEQAATAVAPYLAIGDSIAFGDNGYVALDDPLRSKPWAFVGYPEGVAAARYRSLRHANLACPGETSSSFLDPTAPDNGCQAYKAKSPTQLKFAYEGSQMNAALSVLATRSVELVTLNVGANDLLLLRKNCRIASHPNDPTPCIANGLPATLQTVGANVGRILATVRGAGYRGTIVVMNQYASNYNDPLEAQVLPLLNGVFAQVAANPQIGARIADAHEAFRRASGESGDPCAAGLLIPNPDRRVGGCDIHPSAKGMVVLTKTVADAAR